MKKYHNILYLSLSCLVLIVVCAYLLDNYIELSKLSLDTVTNVGTILASLGAFSIAILLYRRFNGSQSLVDEQTKAIMRLVKYISDIRIFTEKNIDGKPVDFSYNILVFNYRHRNKEENIFADSKGKEVKQYADHSLIGLTSGLGDFSSELYLPKIIAEKIKQSFLYSSWSAEKQSDVPPLYVKVSARGNFDTPEPINIGGGDAEYSNLLAKMDKKIFNVEDLLQSIENIYEEATRWLSSNNPDVYSSLNLSPTKKTDFI